MQHHQPQPRLHARRPVYTPAPAPATPPGESSIVLFFLAVFAAALGLLFALMRLSSDLDSRLDEFEARAVAAARLEEQALEQVLLMQGAGL